MSKEEKLQELISEGDEIILEQMDFECECGETKFFCGINADGFLVLQCPVCFNIRVLTKNPEDFILEANHLSDQGVKENEG